jgi:chaperone modulatory protein CbpM
MTEFQRHAGVVVEEHIVFTLPDLCRACGVGPAQVLALVDEGLLDPTGSGPQTWLFSGPALATARTAMRLARDLDIGLAGAAIVMDLLARIEELQARQR